MSLYIGEIAMTSDDTAHFARRQHARPGQDQGWEVSWLAGRKLDRNQAITAMHLAIYAGGGPRFDPFEPTLESWAAELGVSLDEARFLIGAAP